MGIREFLRQYNTYRDKIFTYFLYRVNFDRDTAEDLTSDVFLSVFQARRRFEKNRSFQSWVYAIAHHRLVDFYRRDHKTLSFDQLVIEHEPSSAPEEVWMQHIEADRLMQLLHELPNDEQYLITLRHVDELSYKEMAEILHKREGAVRTAVSRAVADLRALALFPRRQGGTAHGVTP